MNQTKFFMNDKKKEKLQKNHEPMWALQLNHELKKYNIYHELWF